jgi:hypothetical protein
MKKFTKILEEVENTKFYKINAEVELIVKAETEGEAGYLGDSILGGIEEQFKIENDNPVVGNEGSNVTQFFSKLFESREMAHIYHLQVKGDQGSYATHEALGDYYEEIVEILDDTIEVYQGQYGLVDGYDVIDTSDTKSKEPLAYFEELAEYIKHGKKCIHSLLDDVVCLIYKTIYKLKFLK